ncbi:hypothetical protein Bca4012_009649 [Brassica carinata]
MRKCEEEQEHRGESIHVLVRRTSHRKACLYVKVLRENEIRRYGLVVGFDLSSPSPEISKCCHKAMLQIPNWLWKGNLYGTCDEFQEKWRGCSCCSFHHLFLNELVEFLESPTVKIPVGALDIGTITPAEIWRAFETSDRKRYFSTILAFDVDVTPEASQLAEQLQVKVICGGVLETLHQHFKEHVEELTEDPKMEDESIFPGILSILTNAVFSKEDPIVLGVLVVEGFIKVGVPIAYVRTAGCLDLGRIAWIEKYHQPVDVARLGEIAVIKIVASNQEEQRQARSFGRHYDINNDNNILVTRLSRRSINAIRDSHRELTLHHFPSINRGSVRSGVFGLSDIITQIQASKDSGRQSYRGTQENFRSGIRLIVLATWRNWIQLRGLIT